MQSTIEDANDEKSFDDESGLRTEAMGLSRIYNRVTPLVPQVSQRAPH